MNQPCHIQLLGGLKVQTGDRVISRFRTQKTAALLAYLAYFLERTHAREEIVELLWPDDEIENGQRSLRVSLASLRSQLEPPGTPFNSVLIADRRSIRLNPQVISTDVSAFEAAARAAAEIEGDAERASALKQAVDLYRGPFLPGFYDDWAIMERERLEQVYIEVLNRLPGALAEAGDLGSAIDYAHRRVAADSLSEEAHCELIGLLVKAEQFDAARSRFVEMERIFRDELGIAAPSVARALVAGLPAGPSRKNSGAVVETPAAVPAPPRAPAPTAPPGTSAEPRLPLYLTPFFGRESELSMLRSRLSTPGTRLATLTGPGGAGKTRLAVETARALADSFSGRIWFVPLADIDEAELIPDAILRSMGSPRDPALDADEQLGQSLGEAQALLVLDNFEQLAEDGAPAVWSLLECCPGLTCLVTTRQRLGLAGERVIPVSPLAVPAAPGTPERLLEFPSVSLFLDRAQMARPDFQITRDNAAAIAALCERLEGMPLAIELAAAWAGVLTPSQMLSRLEERLSFLESRRKGGLTRQRSLRETIDWSYRLLSPEQQRFFARLSVFRGGWSLEAAEAVCDDPSAVVHLQALQERSLVIGEEEGAQIRFRLLEMLREYARERLEESGEAEAVRRRHLDFFLDLAEGAGEQFGGTDQRATLALLETDHDNLREALRLCVDSPAAREAGLRLAIALTPFWEARGYLSDGRRWLRMLLDESGEVSEPWRARALSAAGTLAWQQADYAAARASLEESVAVWRKRGERREVAAPLNTLANVLADQSDYASARSLYEESLAIRRELEDWRGVAASLNNLAIVALEQGNETAARPLLEESLAIRRELADMRGIATCLNNLGDVAWRGGDLTAAGPLYEESLAIRRQLGDRRGVASSLSHLANVTVAAGNSATAESLYAESLAILRDLGDRRGMTACLEEVARLAIRQGRPEPAARLFGAAEQLRETMRAPLPPVEEARHESEMAALRSLLPADTFESLWRAGRVMNLEAAVELALEGCTEPGRNPLPERGRQADIYREANA